MTTFPPNLTPELAERARRIRLAIFDVDGVLTDGRLFFDDQGREYKGFHVRDGHGIKLLQESGVAVAVISARASPSVSHRMSGLGIRHVYLGQQNKLAAFESLCRELDLDATQVSHAGDDLVDLCILRRVGLAIAVADAHPALLPHVHWQTGAGGGQGAAREVCDLLMTAQGTLPAILASHW